MTRSSLAITLLAVGALALAGCASTGAGTSTRPDRNQLTTEEIDSVNAISMMEVIERLRPRWLIARAARSFGSETGVLVYQDQTLLGGVEQLRQVRPDMVLKARYLDAQTAASTLPGIGTGHVAGAIVLTPRTAR
jgi:hypothetical protein